MGAFTGWLECEGEKFHILYTETSVNRNVGPKGKVTTDLQGGYTTVRIEANNSSFWAEKTMNSRHKTFDWRIDLLQAEDEANMMTLTGSHCYVIDYRIVLDTRNKEQANIFLKFASRELTVGDAVYNAGWINHV